MNNTKKVYTAVFSLLYAAAVFAGGTSDSQQADANKTRSTEKPVIAVSILPQQYFASRIAGNRADILVLVGAGQSPHSYEPTPAQMARLAKARVWVTSGTDFEIALEPKVSAQFPNLKIVHGTEGVTFRTLQEFEEEIPDEHEGDEHEGDEHHHDSNIDRHSWLGRTPAKIMAAHVRDALSLIDPESSEFYRINQEALASDIDLTFDSLKKDLAHLEGKNVLVYHPSFGYFFDEFGIRQNSVETGGKEPTAKTLAAMIERAKKDEVPAVFVQAQFPVAAARTVASQAGATVVALDPLAPDWLANIRKMGEALKNAYK